MTTKSPFGADTQRYWDQRHDLFAKFDRGIQIDREGLFSAKPEAIALDIGRRLAGAVVLDGFCGVGGSAIGFARAGKRVVAVDIDHSRLAMAKANAQIYGVADRIRFEAIDVVSALSSKDFDFDAVYFDPPWGGPDYYKRERFTLSMFRPAAEPLVRSVLAGRLPLALTIPSNFDLGELERFGSQFRVQRNHLRDRLVFSTIYFGDAGLGSD